MWLFTTRGMYSAVENHTNKAQVIVRARAKGDLEALREFVPGLKIQATPERDYQFRVVLHKDVWASIVSKIASEVDYPNFKSAVGDRQSHERADIYGDVWLALLSIAYKLKRHSFWDEYSGDYLNSPSSEPFKDDRPSTPNLITGVMPRQRKRRKARARI